MVRNKLVTNGIGIWLLGLAASTPARSQCVDWTPEGSMAGVDGTVRAMVRWDPDGAGPQPEMLVVGGRFTVAGDTPALNVAAWDGTRWRPLGDGIDGVYDGVLALAVYNGELIAAGDFHGDTTLFDNIRRFDGQHWQRLGGGVARHVNALAVYNGELYVGGQLFGAGADDVNVHFLARWNGESWNDVAGGTSGEVYALHVHDGELIVGGLFSRAGAIDCNSIARWNASEWRSVGGGLDYQVNAIASFEGNLIAGGYFFIESDGIPSFSVARWDGQAWSPMADGLWPEVFSLTAHDGSLFAGGNFAVPSLPGEPYSQDVARWDGTAWQRLARGVRADVYALASFDGMLLAGGDLYSNGDSPVTGIAQWHGSDWHTVGGGQAERYVDLLTEHAGALFAKGYALAGDGTVRQEVTVRDEGVWRPIGACEQYRNIHALASFQDRLVAGGDFTSIDGVVVEGIADWDGAAWHTLGSVGGTVEALVVFENHLYAGLYRRSSNNIDGAVVRWNGTDWEFVGGAFFGPVYALCVHEGQLAAGGGFTAVDGHQANRIARWNGSEWEPLGGGVNSYVTVLASHRGDLFAGGAFNQAEGEPAQYIARWDGVRWRLMPGSTGVSPLAFADLNGVLVVGGYGEFLRLWDGTNWLPFEPGVNGPVHSLIRWDDRLLAAGDFTVAGDRVALGYSSWGQRCEGDVNGDRVVNVFDLARLLSHFGNVPATCDDGDLDGDATVSLRDLTIVLSSFGSTCE